MNDEKIIASFFIFISSFVVFQKPMQMILYVIIFSGSLKGGGGEIKCYSFPPDIEGKPGEGGRSGGGGHITQPVNQSPTNPSKAHQPAEERVYQ